MFRNRISESGRLKYRIKKLESFIKSNLSQREEVIIKGFAKLWNDQDTIDLQPFQFGGTYYQLCVEFCQLVTHGPPYIEVNDKISLDSDHIEYKTEYGDLAFIVDYWLEDELLSRKISILQTKKEMHACISKSLFVALPKVSIIHFNSVIAVLKSSSLPNFMVFKERFSIFIPSQLTTSFIEQASETRKVFRACMH